MAGLGHFALLSLEMLLNMNEFVLQSCKILFIYLKMLISFLNPISAIRTTASSNPNTRHLSYSGHRYWPASKSNGRIGPYYYIMFISIA